MPQSNVPRRFSFYALVGLAIAVGLFFYQVVKPFLLPLFIAAVLALLIRPIYLWFTERLRGYRYVSAAVVTLLVLLLGLLPLTGALLLAGEELYSAGQELMKLDWRQQPIIADIRSWTDDYISESDWKRWQDSAMNSVEGVTREVYDRTRALLSNIIKFIVGLVIVALGLFFFLAEGPAMLQSMQRLSPLEDEDERALFAEFDRVCRGVVLASVVCALAQAILAGIGFAVVGIDRVWLLAGVTMFTSTIPFLGAASVWGCVAVGLALHGDYGSAIGLAIYGTVIVSASDNLIRAYVIHGTAQLHPLIAMISVLGGLQVVGLWGVFVGPIVAAVFYALLKILHQRLETSSTV